MIKITVISLALLASSATVHAEELSQGALLGAMCATCHGREGRGTEATQALAGRDAAVLITQLKAFASGERESTIMMRHASGYSDEELKLVADYFAQLKQ